MFGIQRKRHTPRVFSPTPAVLYMRERAAPLNALHLSLYRPSNYQNDGRRCPAEPSGLSSARDGRETAADRLLNVPTSINYFILHIERIHYLNHQSISLSYYKKQWFIEPDRGRTILRNLRGAQE